MTESDFYDICRKCKEPEERIKWQGRFWELCELVEECDLWAIRKAIHKAKKCHASVSELMDIMKS